ncbi:MAG: YitT family protein [bacterium]
MEESVFKKVFNKKNLISIFWINVGVFFAAISYVFFLEPNYITGGGLSGVAILVQDYLPDFLSTSAFIWICNGILLLTALFLMGKEYFLKTACGAMVYPLYITVLKMLLDILPEDFIDFSNDMYIVVIFGALFMALGIGIAMKNGGTTGGGDIVQSIMFKYFHIPYSKTMYAIEGTLIVSSLVLWGDLTLTLQTILYVILTGVILDTFVFGGFNKRAVYIISEKHEEIKNIIIKDLVRGVTKLNGTGGFNNEDKPVLLCVLSSKEYFELRATIDKLDPHAFTLVMKTSEVRGYGFSLESEARLNAKLEKRIKKANEKK